MDISQFKQKFIDEAFTLLTNLDNTLIELEKDAGNMQFVNEAFRAMHTIKGASGMYGFEKVVEVTHELESLFDIIRETKINVPQNLIELTFIAADHLRALLIDENCTNSENILNNTIFKENIEKIKTGLNLNTTQQINTVKNIIPNETITGIATWNILFYPNEEIIKRAVNLIYTFQDLFQLGEYKINNPPLEKNEKQYWSIFLVTEQAYDEIESALMFIMDYCKIKKIADFNIFDPASFENRDKRIITQELKPTDTTQYENSENLQVTPQKTIEPQPIIIETPVMAVNKIKTSHINVDASKLDTLMYLVSELVTAKSELMLSIQKQNIEKVTDVAEKIEKLSKLFSENALSIRLVSLHEMLSRFKRLIRDLSKQLNKSINFETIGEETELDKNIIDNIGEPIMHLIRNSIDHGIEEANKRIERGKSPVGIIKFEAIKSGNYVYIFISDDGNGINTKYVYNKAIEKGFIASGTELTHNEILELIFLPGFSTAQSLSNVSGRGVGMDIVLQKIHEIRGEISIISNFGSGTTFTLKLQQSISIIETLLVESFGVTYAIPVEDIESCVLEASENIIDNQTNLIGYNNSLIPFINLRTQFSTITKAKNVNSEKLIIIKRSEKMYAIIAENIIGEYQAVIKPLGEAFSELKFLSGASLLGDGSIALLLDTDKLWNEIPTKQAEYAYIP